MGQAPGQRVLCAGEFASLCALRGCWLRKDAWGRADSIAVTAPPADRSHLCKNHTFCIILAPLSSPHAWSNACAPVNALCLSPICCLKGLWVNRGGGAPVRISSACLYRPCASDGEGGAQRPSHEGRPGLEPQPWCSALAMVSCGGATDLSCY